MYIVQRKYVCMYVHMYIMYICTYIQMLYNVHVHIQPYNTKYYNTYVHNLHNYIQLYMYN